MRLINATTIMMENFSNKVPVYAILSHTWEDEEVTLQEMLARETVPDIDVERKRGFTKIKKTCEQAVLDGFTYVWVDTCCIDKTSSSELSEAINSMYKWYQEAEVCYAYLMDVSASENAFDPNSQFRRCKWFTRGWTLQELVAPLSLVFYDKEWVEIGTKSSLRKVITQVTNIGKQVLLVNHSGEISIAARMSWAANRQTTRIEDMAYCLLGLFGINMPILYGEGEGAFTRLQREIIATSDDHTIFAWVGGHGGAGSAGLLAKSPAEFSRSSHLAHRKVDKDRSPYNITNVGLSIELPLQPVSGQANQFKALLNC
ncbi:heterokaryon incompatibility protein-domain-containing protein, partial [Flammula alnicola]